MTKKFEFQTIALRLWKADRAAFGASEASAKELGAALNDVKSVSPHGEFQKWLKACSIDRNRASYCMRVANGKQKKVEKPKVMEERFILDGLPDATRQQLIGLAARAEVAFGQGESPGMPATARGISLPRYVLRVLQAHVHSEVTLPRYAHEYGAWVNHDYERLRRIPLLGTEVIHAENWRGRTVERCRRLLAVVKPARALGLSEFVNVFENVYGTDLLPLKWILAEKKGGEAWNVDVLALHYGWGFTQSTRTRLNNRKLEEGGAVPFDGPARLLSPSDVGQPAYSDEEEARRIEGLKTEQKSIEEAHAELYDGNYIFHYGMAFKEPNKPRLKRKAREKKKAADKSAREKKAA